MAFGTLVQKAITWGTDLVSKNSTVDGAIKKNEWSIAQLYTAVDTDGTLAGNSNDNISTEKAVKTYADAINAKVIVGDGTAGRKIIGFNLTFTGDDDDTAHLYGLGVWNNTGNFTTFGEGASETCDLSSTSANGYWSLDADGDTATLIAEAKCLGAGKDFLHVISADLVDQNTTGILHVLPAVSGGNITLTFSDGSSGVVDLTVASMVIQVNITAIISA